MRIPAFNCGSSTLRFKCFEVDHHTPPGIEKVRARGSFDRLVRYGQVFWSGAPGNIPTREEMAALDGKMFSQGILWGRQET